MLRNVASQRWYVIAFNSVTNARVTGGAAAITAKISIDNGAFTATNDVNPTEVSATDWPGVYYFDTTQAETNGAVLALAPVSSTANVEVHGFPPVIWTRAQYDSVAAIDSAGVINADTIKVSTDATAANNLERWFDGTVGFGTATDIVSGSLTGAVGSVGGNVGGNVVGSVGSVVGHTNQTGDVYALANGANGFVAIKSDTAAILIDSNELQTDWVNGGRLDLILDARASQTGLDDVPTNTELTAALAAADDATLAAINALPTDADVQAAAAAALNAYDPPTNAEMEARTLLAAAYGTATNQTTILARLGAWTGTGLNTILGAFRALMAKAAALTPSDISTGTTFDNTSDSAEAIRDSITALDVATGDATEAKQDQLLALFAAGLPATGPALQRGAFTVVRGDTYGTGARTDLTVTMQPSSHWPTDLNDYTWELNAELHPDDTNLGTAIAGDIEIVTATGTGRAFRFAFTSAETEAAAVARHLVSVTGYTADSPAKYWTILIGSISVEDNFAA